VGGGAFSRARLLASIVVRSDPNESGLHGERFPSGGNLMGSLALLAELQSFAYGGSNTGSRTMMLRHSGIAEESGDFCPSPCGPVCEASMPRVDPHTQHGCVRGLRCGFMI
jgi:hypothetical protein